MNETQAKQLSEVHDAIYGNGQPGMKVRLDRVERILFWVCKVTGLICASAIVACFTLLVAWVKGS